MYGRGVRSFIVNLTTRSFELKGGRTEGQGEEEDIRMAATEHYTVWECGYRVCDTSCPILWTDVPDTIGVSRGLS